MQMHLLDYGYKEWISRDCLRPLRREHMKVQWSAQQCHLVDISPLSGDNWSQQTCEILLALVNGKKCYMQNKVFVCYTLRHDYRTDRRALHGITSSIYGLFTWRFQAI